MWHILICALVEEVRKLMLAGLHRRIFDVAMVGAAELVD